MKHESPSPDEQTTLPAPFLLSEPDFPAVATDLEDSFFETRRFREGGWDGPSKAMFIGTLAETGVVTFACRACQMSAKSAYALRHRDPVFSKAWEAALDMARHRLADELLARSLKGSAEQLLRDGCIVGERHHYDNKLAFAILRRLDRQSELGATFRTPPAWDIPAPAPAVSGQWQGLLDALGENREDDAASLLAPVKYEQGNTQGNNPPVEGVKDDEMDDEPYVPKRVWQEYLSDAWRTNFPAPPDFDGEEKGNWEDQGYSRSLTDAELAAVTAGDTGEEIVTLSQDEAERDAFFAALAVPVPPPSAGADTSPCEGEELSVNAPPPVLGEGARSAGGGTTFQKVTNDCPPPKPSAKGKT